MTLKMISNELLVELLKDKVSKRNHVIGNVTCDLEIEHRTLFRTSENSNNSRHLKK